MITVTVKFKDGRTFVYKWVANDKNYNAVMRLGKNRLVASVHTDWQPAQK